MATHSSVLAWRIPVMGEPGGLPSMGSHRVRHDWSDLAAAAAATRGLWDYLQFFSFFLLYSTLQKLFRPSYLPAHWFVLLLQIFCYWFPSRVFLISVNELFVCLYFNSSRSLLIDCCIFSILFSRLLIIFPIIILNTFSGSLPVPFHLFLDFCFLLVPSFV